LKTFKSRRQKKKKNQNNENATPTGESQRAIYSFPPPDENRT